MAAPAPLLALSSPKPQFKFLKDLNRRIFGHHHHHPRPTLLCCFVVSLIGAFSLLFSFRFLLSDGRSRWTFLPFTNRRPPSPAEPRKDSFIPFATTSSFHPVAYSHLETQSKSLSELCASFPHHITQNRIQAVLKIGHGESREKLQAQLNSVSACFQPGELLIFSDLDEDLVLGDSTNTTNSPTEKGKGKQNIHRAIDVLSNLPSAYFDAYPQNKDGESSISQAEEFINYEAMISLSKSGNLTVENDPTRKDNTGWKLDKYKFLGEVERAWEMRPNKEWYVFYETDTYIVWDNLFRFLLGGLDPDADWYMGSPSPGRVDDDYSDPNDGGRRKKVKTWFANGGPGFVLSRGAMRKLLKREVDELGRLVTPPLTIQWLDTIRSDCCGDSVLGWALWKVGIKLSGLFPMFNVYPLHGVPFSERKWCQPIFTMHKTLPGHMEDLWRWEQGVRKLGRPLLHADLYEFKSPGGSFTGGGEVRKNWDNTNYDKEAKGGHDVRAESLEECKKACRGDEKCLQYMWRGEDRDSCVLMVFINLGLEKQPERKEKNVTVENPKRGEASWRTEVEVTTFTSGWMAERIEDWKRRHACDEVDWLWPSLERFF